MKSLIAIQFPEVAEGMAGLGAYRTQPMPDGWKEGDPVYDYTAYDAAVEAENKRIADEKAAQEAADKAAQDAAKIAQEAAASASAAETPESILATSKRLAFLNSLRPGFDYGMGSNSRNALYSRDSALGLDIFGTIIESVKKSAPQAFKGIKGSEVLKGAGLPQIRTGITLPSWVPRISVPKPIQGAVKTVAQKAIADLRAKKAAESSGVAAQTADYNSDGSPAPTSNMNPWAIGGVVAILGLAYAASRRRR